MLEQKTKYQYEITPDKNIQVKEIDTDLPSDLPEVASIANLFWTAEVKAAKKKKKEKIEADLEKLKGK